jgi:hypothetical protein
MADNLMRTKTLANIKSAYLCLTFGLVALWGCAMTTDVMDAGDGTYLISGRASPIRGGSTGATSVAYADAQKFCAEKGSGLRAIVVNANERDVYQSSVGGSASPYGGGFGGTSAAAGSANLRFRCAQ